MRRPLFILRCALAFPGIALLSASALLLSEGVFGTWRFVLGLLFHMAGQACCLGSLCLPMKWQARRTRQAARVSALSAVQSRSVRAAHFRPEVQIIRLVCGVGLSILLVGWLGVGAWRLGNLLRLRAQGVVTDAAITGTSFREGGALLTVTYAFPVPRGLPVTDTFRAPRLQLPLLRTGNLLPVTYLPANPSVHAWQRVDNAFVVRHCLSGALLFVTVVAYVGGPFLWAERRLRRQLRLARVGVGTTGAIVICRPLLWRKTRRGYLLTYTFAAPDRHVFVGRALIPHLPDEPTLPGFPLTVLYDPLYPGISLPLAAFHVVELANARKAVLAA